jgi:Fur family transcriptional regulator, iron response regulator
MSGGRSATFERRDSEVRKMARPDSDLQPTGCVYAHTTDHNDPRGISLAERAKRNSNPEPDASIKSLIRQSGLRPTRQRMALAALLFGRGERHFTAEMLFEEARRAKISLSLATIYNTLHSFIDAGLLRQIPIDGSKAFFDTNARDHHHFLVEGTNDVIDVCPSELTISKTPTAPDGFEIVKIDVIVRVRRKALRDVCPAPALPAR